jgi:hypothetical protein
MVEADCSGSFGCRSPKEAPPRAGHCSVPAPSCRGLPAVARVAHVLVRASRRGGGNAGRVSGYRPEGRKDFHRCNGRGHRPCHSATLTSGQPGAQSPRPAPDPPLAGASPPPGRALACVPPGPAGLQGTVAREGQRGLRFGVGPEPRPPRRITKVFPSDGWSGCCFSTVPNHARIHLPEVQVWPSCRYSRRAGPSGQAAGWSRGPEGAFCNADCPDCNLRDPGHQRC